jgi:hypothetical protein
LRPASGRPAARLAVLGVLALAGAGALAGCGTRPVARSLPPPTSSPSARPSRPAVDPRTSAPATPAPTVSAVAATPSPTPTATARAVASRPAVVPACRAGQLSAGMPHISAGTGGQQAAFVELRNTGPASCALGGYARVSLLSASGSSLPTRVSDDPLYPRRVVLLPADTGPVIPGRPSQGHGYIMVIFNEYNSAAGLCSAAQIEHPASLAVTLPGSDTVLRVPARATDGSGKAVASCRGDLQVTPVGTLDQANNG